MSVLLLKCQYAVKSNAETIASTLLFAAYYKAKSLLYKVFGKPRRNPGLPE
jgi:hypothetical protein